MPKLQGKQLARVMALLRQAGRTTKRLVRHALPNERFMRRVNRETIRNTGFSAKEVETAMRKDVHRTAKAHVSPLINKAKKAAKGDLFAELESLEHARAINKTMSEINAFKQTLPKSYKIAEKLARRRRAAGGAAILVGGGAASGFAYKNEKRINKQLEKPAVAGGLIGGIAGGIAGNRLGMPIVGSVVGVGLGASTNHYLSKKHTRVRRVKDK